MRCWKRWTLSRLTGRLISHFGRPKNTLRQRNGAQWRLIGREAMTAQAPETRPRGLIKSPFDFAGGLFLLLLAGLGLAGGFNLPTGTLSGIGSGLMPRV